MRVLLASGLLLTVFAACPQAAVDCASACEGAQVPAPSCDGDERVTSSLDLTHCELRCETTTARQRCEFGCRDGACLAATGDAGASSDDAGSTSDDAGTGSDAGADPCEGLSCHSPPANRCLDAQQLEVAAPQGTCTAGACQYPTHTEPCSAGCANGACVDNPCQGVTCASPPASVCADASTLRTFAPSGTCNGAGTCEYPAQTLTCQFGCSGGACVNDPCAGVTCATPPAAFCASASTLRTWSATGACTAGTCSYTPSDVTCQLGCSNGACVNDPCAGVTCSTPPASACVDSSTLRTWSGAGTCTGGSCSYTPTDLTCAHGCSNGACVNDPCAGVSCSTPPATTCLDATTRRAWLTPGTCSQGACSYAPQDQACPFGCSNGACASDPCMGVSCTTPPASTCEGPDSVRTWSSPGTCAAGTCSYPALVTQCPAAPAATCADPYTQRAFTSACSGGACGVTSVDTACPGGCLAGACVPVVCDRAQTRPCTAECFCEENLLDDESLLDVAALSANDVWACGTHGSLLHFDGGTWAKTPPLTNQTLWTLKATTANTLWAVGSGGTVLRMRNGAWEAVDAGTTETLRAVDGTETYLWAVGDHGTVDFFDGTTWSVRDAGATASLSGVSVAGTVTIVGATGSTPLAFNASSASITPRTVPAGSGALTSVSSGTAGLEAVGYQGTVLTGSSASTWTKATVPASAATSYLARVRGDWVVGNSTLSTNGVTWSDQSNTVSYGWAGVDTVHSGAGGTYFVGGGSAALWYQGTLKRFNPGRITFHGVWGAAGDAVWLVAEDGQLKGHLYKWDGARLVEGAPPNAAWGQDILHGVWGTSASDVFAVGEGDTILHYDGVSWAVQRYVFGNRWQAVHGSSSTNVWAVAYNALARYDGTSWTIDTLTGFGALNDVFTFGPNEGWVVGGSASARHRVGTTWTTVATGTSGTVGAVWATSPTDVWVGGSGGFLARWNGSSFVAVPTGTTQTITHITGRGPADVFISGSGGMARHWDGARWRDVDVGAGTTRALEGSWAGPGDEAWFVGAQGVVRRHAH